MVTFPLHGAGAAIGNALFGRNLKMTMTTGVAHGSSMTVTGIDPVSDELLSVIEFNPAATRFGFIEGANADTNMALVSQRGQTVATAGIQVGDPVIGAIQLDLSTHDISKLATTASSSLDGHLRCTSAGYIQAIATTSGDVNLVAWNDVSKTMIDRTSECKVVGHGLVEFKPASALATLAAATYDDNAGNVDQEVVLANAFLTYDWNLGDMFYATGGTGLTLTTGTAVNGRLNENSIQVAGQLNGTPGDIAGDLAGYIMRGILGSRVLCIWTSRQING